MAIVPPMVAAAARAPAPPTGTLTLMMDDPVISVRAGATVLRLRVDFDQRGSVELNGAAAVRLGLPFEEGATDAVGAIDVPSRIAAGSFELDGRTVAVTFSTHGDCCLGVDGAISPALLPYAAVDLVRDTPLATRSLAFTMRSDRDHGLEVVEPIGRAAVRLRLSLVRGETLATASAGAIIGAAHGGRLAGGTAPVDVAFGIRRPTRLLTLATPVSLAGFGFTMLRTRTADFGGRRALSQEPGEPGEIVVRRRVRKQPDWPAIVIGRDRLDRCRQIRFAPPTRTLTLRCDFAGAGG